MMFYLGTHQPDWMRYMTEPLFVSDRRLRRYKTLPRAAGAWALDSGGFTELSTHGTWANGPSPTEYVDRVLRYDREIGSMQWAAPQDWMCEPFITAKTGLSVLEHQRRTIANVVELRQLWYDRTDADCPFISVLQGWEFDDYQRCVDMYFDAGVDLSVENLVGLGSVCRRQATEEIGAIVNSLQALPLHGFGVKRRGLELYGHMLESADSMAWSYSARREAPLLECLGSKHKNCANCPTYALRWRSSVLAGAA